MEKLNNSGCCRLLKYTSSFIMAMLFMATLAILPCDIAMAYEVWPYHIEITSDSCISK